MNAIEQFRDAILAAGLSPPEVIKSDGRVHRFPSNGKRGDDAGEYIFHNDGIPAGWFRDFRTDVSQTWRADIGRKLAPSEEAAYRAKVEAMREKRDAFEARKWEDARRKTAEVWKAAARAREDHPYLQRKGNKPVSTLRELPADQLAAILCYTPASKGEPLRGRVLIAPVKIGDTLSTAEFIDEHGRKSALAGGEKKGGYWAAQALPEGNGVALVLLIGEGVATVL